MVIDLKQIHLKQTIENDALWVIEQIPGYTQGADQSAILRTGTLVVDVQKGRPVFSCWPESTTPNQPTASPPASYFVQDSEPCVDFECV